MINPTSVPYDDVIGGDRDIRGNGGSITRRVVNDGILSRRDGVTGPVTCGVQSVLVAPVQSAALAAERPNEATKAVRMCVVNFFKFIFI